MEETEIDKIIYQIGICDNLEELKSLVKMLAKYVKKMNE